MMVALEQPSGVVGLETTRCAWCVDASTREEQSNKLHQSIQMREVNYGTNHSLAHSQDIEEKMAERSALVVCDMRQSGDMYEVRAARGEMSYVCTSVCVHRAQARERDARV